MIYLVCFLISIITMIFLVANSKNVDINVATLAVICVIGNGGYYALFLSQNLTEAILANKITYSIGCFVPMIMFMLICKICSVNISIPTQVVLYSLQSLIYLSVCTSGTYDFFYKTVEYNVGSYGAYLTKTYGPMHSVYMVGFCIYIVASMMVVGISIRRKNCRVSDNNAYALLTLFIISAVLYFTERFAKLTFELEPMIFTVTSFWVILIYIRIMRYSADDNLTILEAMNKEEAYIVFDKKLNYMSSNDYAIELFPELKEWEIGSMIPGNGGRFNTFLRVPFMRYVKGELDESYISGYEYMKKYYRVEISKLLANKFKEYGYVIKVSLDVVKTRELSEIN